nr:16074_t:CDS:2 [Entrophospora candida]
MSLPVRASKCQSKNRIEPTKTEQLNESQNKKRIGLSRIYTFGLIAPIILYRDIELLKKRETKTRVVAALGALDSLDAHNVLVDYVDCVVADDDADDVQQKALDQYIK